MGYQLNGNCAAQGVVPRPNSIHWHILGSDSKPRPCVLKGNSGRITVPHIREQARSLGTFPMS